MKATKNGFTPKDKVSIVLPTYNRDWCISDAIRSVLGQDRKRFELIIVNDGSTDNTAELLEWWKKRDPRIKVITSVENQGVGKARNLGNAMARGDIIVVMDSDDLMLKNRLTEVLYSWKEYKWDICYTDYFRGDQFGNPKIGIAPGEFTDDMLDGKQTVPHLTVAYRKHVAQQCPYKDVRINDDWFFLVDVYNAGFKFNYSNIPTMIERSFGSGISRQNRKQYDEDFKNYKIDKALREKNVKENT